MMIICFATGFVIGIGATIVAMVLIDDYLSKKG